MRLRKGSFKAWVRPVRSRRALPGILTRLKDRERALAKIQQAIPDENVATTSILRDCITVGNLADFTTLRNWAAKELRGYGSDDKVPSYRRIVARICIDGQADPNLLREKSIGIEGLSDAVQINSTNDELPLRQGLKELETLAHTAGTSLRLGLPGGSLTGKMVNAKLDASEPVFEVYWTVSPETLQHVVEQVRTLVAELVDELRATLSVDADTPSAQAQAVNYVISGKHQTINVTTSQAASGGTNTIAPTEPGNVDESWWTRWRKRGLLIGFSTVVSATVVVATWLGWTPW